LDWIFKMKTDNFIERHSQKSELIIYKLVAVLFIVSVFFNLSILQAQVIELNRGRLWHSFHYGQECAPLYDWRYVKPGLDWPGCDINTLVGGTYTYLMSGGFFLSSLRTENPDTVASWLDFCINGDRNVSSQLSAKHIHVLKHAKKWANGENYYLQTDPNEAEEVIETILEKDPQYVDDKEENKKLPVLITRTVRQWSGSRADEDYVIVRYVIKRHPTEAKGLTNAYLLFSYAISPNYRGWLYTNPNFLPGAKNTDSRWDADSRLLTAWAGDFRSTSESESFDFYKWLQYNPFTRENEEKTEFLAPAIMGIKFLKISKDNTGEENHINGFSWSVAPLTGDYEGPFSGVSGLTNKYAAMKNPLLLAQGQAFDDPTDTRMRDNRVYANISLGPFTIRQRSQDSIEVIIAEFVGGMDYERAIIETDPNVVQQAVDSASAYLSARVTFNYEHQFRVPMPPPGPTFSVGLSKVSGSIGNVISFSDNVENVNDPHQGVPDVAGYRIYRSGRYPFGPWIQIADIPVKSVQFWSSDSSKYLFVDNQVALGYGYYYSVTSYDGGHAQWEIDPAVSVPSLESSIFANRTTSSFFTTLMPTEGKGSLENVVVVPNPFFISSGFTRVGDEKKIQFVNIPTECTVRIFTLRGDLVKTIHHSDANSGVAMWNQISDYGQYVKSGLYFYHIETPDGQTTSGKFAIVN